MTVKGIVILNEVKDLGARAIRFFANELRMTELH